MRIRSKLLAVAATAALSVGGVLVSATAATAADDLVLDVPTTTFEAYDDTWGGGIAFSSSGWTPGATVVVSLSVLFTGSSGDGDSTEFVADDEGNIAGTWIPEYGAYPPSDTGYPQYVLSAYEPGASGPVNSAPGVPLTVEVASTAPTPTVEVINNSFEPGDTWGDGFILRGTQWEPNSSVTVWLVRIAADGTREEVSEVVETNIIGSFNVLLTPINIPAEAPDSSGYPQFVVYAEQDQNGDVVRSNEVVLNVLGQGDSGGAGDPADGEVLPATGAAEDAVVTMGTAAAGVILLGLALVVAMNRRRIAGMFTREQ